jgi:hypothetical protein
MLQLGANTLAVELLTPLFRVGRDGLPSLKSPSDQTFILTDFANALSNLGRQGEALVLYEKSLGINVERSSRQHMPSTEAASSTDNGCWGNSMLGRFRLYPRTNRATLSTFPASVSFTRGR